MGNRFSTVCRLAGLLPSAVLLATASGACSRPAQTPPVDVVRIVTRGPTSERFAAEYQQALPGVRLSIRSAPGSDFVVSAILQGEADMGVAQADVVYAAYRAGLAKVSRPPVALRGIALIDTANVYLAVRRTSPLRRIEDLKNRRVGVFPSSTHAQVYTRLILDEYGLWNSVAELKEYDADEMAKHLRDGTLDAAMFGGGASIPPVLSQLNRSVGVRLLDITGPVVTRLRGQYPFFLPLTVSPVDLPGQEGTVQTLGVESLMVCRQDLREDLVYKLTRALFEASSPAGAAFHGVSPDLAPATPIPLHAGAARFYREREILQ